MDMFVVAFHRASRLGVFLPVRNATLIISSLPPYRPFSPHAHPNFRHLIPFSSSHKPLQPALPSGGTHAVDCLE